jgi:hypothetical protein
MQKLTNLRYRFNDGDFFKNMAYPEVDFIESANSKPAFLSNKEYKNKTDFDKQFKSIIWISYRRNFPPLFRTSEPAMEEAKKT